MLRNSISRNLSSAQARRTIQFKGFNSIYCCCSLLKFCFDFLFVCLLGVVNCNQLQTSTGHHLQHSKPKGACSVLPGLRHSTGAAPCIIQDQAPWHWGCLLVIPLVGLSSCLHGNCFHCQEYLWGPALLACGSAAPLWVLQFSSCGVSIFRCLVLSVLFIIGTNHRITASQDGLC